MTVLRWDGGAEEVTRGGRGAGDGAVCVSLRAIQVKNPFEIRKARCLVEKTYQAPVHQHDVAVRNARYQMCRRMLGGAHHDKRKRTLLRPKRRKAMGERAVTLAFLLYGDDSAWWTTYI